MKKPSDGTEPPKDFEVERGASWSRWARHRSDDELEEIAKHAVPNELRVRIELRTLGEDALDRLEDLFAAAPGPCQVVFELCSPDGSVAILQAQQRVKNTTELADAVREICGNAAVRTVPE